MREYILLTDVIEKVWHKMIRHINDAMIMPNQMTSLVHKGVEGEIVVEKILMKNKTVCGLDKSEITPRLK